MKVFISWSGEKSKKVAEILKQWIPFVIQNIEPYFSSSDIDKGARWSTDIAKELEAASFGILCITNENVNSSWLNFEAGALSKSIDKSRVCPLLFDIKTSEITGSPILQFQMSTISMDDVFQLFISMNNALGDAALDTSRLKTSFDLVWSKIDDALKAILAETKAVSRPAKPQTIDQSKAIEEILDLARMQIRLLKSPEELIPIDYLSSAIEKRFISPRSSNEDFMASDLLSRTKYVIRRTFAYIESHSDKLLSLMTDETGSISDEKKINDTIIIIQGILDVIKDTKKDIGISTDRVFVKTVRPVLKNKSMIE